MSSELAQGALLGRVARLYYEHGMTHAEIASRLHLSRIKVTRLLADARRLGIVEITVHSDERPFPDLEERLRERFDVTSSWVAPSNGRDADRAEASLARDGGLALVDLLPRDGSVVVGLSRSVAAAIKQLSGVEALGMEVLPIGGSRGGRVTGTDPYAIALSLSQVTGSALFHVPAPLIAASADAARGMLEDPDISATLARSAGADMIAMGVGGNSRATQALRPWITDREFDALRDHGAVGDISGRFFDASGAAILSDVDARIVGLTLEQMLAIPVRLVIAAGEEKIPAIRTALAHGFATALVTDDETANALLA